MRRAEGSAEQTLTNTELISGAAVEGRREAKELDEHRHGGGAPGTPGSAKSGFSSKHSSKCHYRSGTPGHPGLWLPTGKALKAPEEVS